MSIGRLSLVVVALTAALIALLGYGAVGTEEEDVGSLHREILEILHGPPRTDVAPTPHYCARLGRGPAKLQIDDFDWYLGGSDKCSAVYFPNLGSISTPLSDGGEIQQFFFDDEKYPKLESALHRLAQEMEASRPSVGTKLDVQMTLWELVAALQFRRDIRVEPEPEISQPKVDRLLVPALRGLRATLFTEGEVDALPATLPRLAELSGVPGIDPWVKRLLSGDQRILEDVFPTQLHNAFAQGRLFSRVFLTLEDPEELEDLRADLVDRSNTLLQGFEWQTAPSLRREEIEYGYSVDLMDLPQRYSSVRTILILFFNVLNTRYEVVPTPMVAAWMEIWFDRKLDPGADFRAADRALALRIVEYEKHLGLGQTGSFPEYRKIAEDEISRVKFTNVNPVYPNAAVTTVRAQCLSCHAKQIRTFLAHQKKIGFAVPFSRRPEELYGRNVEQKAGRSFEEWTRQYLEKTEDER